MLRQRKQLHTVQLTYCDNSLSMPAKLIIPLSLYSGLTGVFKHKIEQITLQSGAYFGRALSAMDGQAKQASSMLLL